MLYNDVNEFNWSVDNIGTLTNAAMGAEATSGADNTKGSAVSLIAGASVTEDIYGLFIWFVGGSTNTAQRVFLADIVIDPAGGTSWSTLINNLLVCAPDLAFGGYNYYFPIFIKAGTSIGFQHQCNAATQTMRCAVKGFGKPTRPDLLRYGTKVETIGANTASTEGTAITPGTSGAWGSYASLGTTTQDNWWWQIGTSVGDDTGGASTTLYYFDLACGDATNKKGCVTNSCLVYGTTERGGRDDYCGDTIPIKSIPSGETAYVRGLNPTGTNDSNITATAYGVC
jgi:hypothetical protein